MHIRRLHHVRAFRKAGLGIAAPLRKAGLGIAAAAVGVTLMGAGVAQATGPRPLPPGSTALARAINAADAADGEPGVTTRSAATGSLADADAAATAVNTSGCNTQTVADTSGTGATRRVSIFGASTVFDVGSISKFWWRTPPNPVPVWSLYFRGLMWIGPAIAAGATDAASIDAFVTAAVRSVAVNPDPGTAKFGWDEGSNLRRQMALNCLYRASGADQRLVPAITATATANMDASRYYGLPNHKPHNHGVMANLALLDAGQLLHNATWRDVATQRLLRDSSGAFTAGGITIEQSACYDMVNINLWGNVANALLASTDPTVRASAATVQANVDRAKRALSFLTTPQGLLVPFGDCENQAGSTVAQPTASIRDDAAGVLSDRWSWTDPNTSYYLVRYGPRRYAHGHEDRQSLVWNTLGMSVLNDSGTYSYNPGPYSSYAVGRDGHSVQVVSGRAFVLGAPVTLVSRGGSGSVHSVVLRDAQYGLTHTRTWWVDNPNHQVTLQDTVAAAAASSLHLDSAWSLVSQSSDHKVATFRHTNGHTLTVRGSSPMLIYVGSTRPVAGWRFPHPDHRQWAPQIVMNTTAGTSRVTLKVT